MSSVAAVAWSGELAAFGIGVLFGAVIQRGHFCTMGCVSDVVLFGSFRRARVWALAAATALVGSQALALAGAIDLNGTTYRGSSSWLDGVGGGVLFGFGMVLAGGCLSRNLARLGAGSLKALATLAMAAVTALATMSALGAVAAAPEDAPRAPAESAGLLLGAAIVAALLAFALSDARLRRDRADLATALTLGALPPLAWLAAFSPAGVSFVDGEPASTIALLAGTVLGAAAVAGWRGHLRLETFVGRADLLRHVVGGALMGVGGALAAGCTIGHGLSGVSTLSVGSLLTLVAMLVGGWWGVKYLETNRIMPFLGTATARNSG